MLRNLTKFAAVGLLGIATFVASSDMASARNWGRRGGGYGYGAPAVRYYGGSCVYGGYNGGYVPRVYNGYYGSPYVNRYYGNRYYNNGYYNNGYYNNGYYNGGYYNGGYYGNSYYGSNYYAPGGVGLSIGW